MATIAELIDSRQYTRDSNGKEAGTRVFRVLEAQNEAGARDEFYALTDYNRFPGAGFGCVLDRVSVEGRNGNTLFIVTAIYSSFKGFIKRDEPEESFQPYFGWGYKKATVTLPFVYQTTLTTSSGELQATKQVWSAKTIDIAEVRIARTLKVRYETDNSNTLDVIAEAVGVPRRNVSIVSGDRSRNKRVAIAGVTRDTAGRAFSPRQAREDPERSRGVTARQIDQK